MKLLVLAIILFSLYLIYRLSFPRQAGNSSVNETPPPKPPDGDDAVVKSRFVLPVQSNSTQHADRKQDSDRQEENASIFAAGNEKKDAVIPPEELGEVFSEDMNPDDLDIEPDASETDSGDEPDADEEAEEIRGSAGEIEGYAEGFTYDELATAIHEADQPEAMAKATVETLRNLSQTDMFEKLVSGDAGRAVSEQYLSHLREKGISYLFAGADGSAIATTGSGDAAQPFLTVLVWCGSIPTHLIERRNNQKH